MTLVNVSAGISGSGVGLTGATALFSPPTTKSCIAENMIFLCDIMTPRDINAMNTGEVTHGWLCKSCLTFGRAGRSAGE